MNYSDYKSDIAVSSRVRLARNLENRIFPNKAREDSAETTRLDIIEAISAVKERTDELRIYDIDRLSDIEKQSLVEKNLISNELGLNPSSACAISADETKSIMINEDDHLRIQGIVKGFDLKTAYVIADELESALSEKLTFAFSDKYGYLTSCPTNTACGIRAGVMLHLPALSLTSRLSKVVMLTSKFGLTVRGIYGEGSLALGDLFQISNQNSLGLSGDDIIENLQKVCKEIILMERAQRSELIKINEIFVRDTVCRAYGILTNAFTISTAEALKLLSDVRLGVDYGIIEGISSAALDMLSVDIRPATLCMRYKTDLDRLDRGVRRAALIKNILKNKGMGE